MERIAAAIIFVLILWSLNGCAIRSFSKSTNVPAVEDPSPTRATMSLRPRDVSDGLFIGIALSGGGSRAANFSAAALRSLHELGFLQRATVISSVSGSSLTAASYGLSMDKDDLNWNTLREDLSADFQTRWQLKMFLSPVRWLLYAFTSYNRTDTMAEVLDDVLYHNATFGEMSPKPPYILINATELSLRSRFTFADETFLDIGSRLDTYPISQAVIASGAFPGIFRSVTIRDYLEARAFKHLFDGGPYDNLGMNAIIDVMRRYARTVDSSKVPIATPTDELKSQIQPLDKNPYFKACLIMLVDAYPDAWAEGKYNEDLGGHSVIDGNFMNSFDVLLSGNREKMLDKIGLSQSYLPITRWELDLTDSDATVSQRMKQTCMVWHITFQRLKHLYPKVSHALGLWQYVNNIPTLYRLEAPPGRSGIGNPREVLYEAADVLIKKDEAVLKSICTYLFDYFKQAKESVEPFNIYTMQPPWETIRGSWRNARHPFEGCEDPSVFSAPVPTHMLEHGDKSTEP